MLRGHRLRDRAILRSRSRVAEAYPANESAQPYYGDNSRGDWQGNGGPADNNPNSSNKSYNDTSYNDTNYNNTNYNNTNYNNTNYNNTNYNNTNYSNGVDAYSQYLDNSVPPAPQPRPHPQPEPQQP